MTDIIIALNKNRDKILGNPKRYNYFFTVTPDGLVLRLEELRLENNMPHLTVAMPDNKEYLILRDNKGYVTFCDRQETMIGITDHPSDIRVLSIEPTIIPDISLHTARLPNLTYNNYTITTGPRYDYDSRQS